MKKIARFVVALALFIVASQAHGVTFTATGIGKSPGETLKASVVFAVSNLDLIVTLSNTGTFDPRTPADVLAAVFFKIDGDPKLTPVSAELGTNSSIIAFPLPMGFDGDVGGEWAYRNDPVRAPGGANNGISSGALKWFGGKKYLFPGEKLHGAGRPGGIDFGLTTMNDLPGNDRGGLKHQGLIRDSVQFVLFGLPDNFSLTEISDVTLQYGTSIKQPEITGEELAIIPEPSTMVLAAVGLLGAIPFVRRRTARR
jgi:hypothetical protein